MDWIDGDFMSEGPHGPFDIQWHELNGTHTTPVIIPQPDISAGVKFDDGKPMYDLIDPYFTEGLAKVLTFGAGKYDKHNWRSGIVFSRLIASLERHMAEIKKGNDIDTESGLPHIFHVACNSMFLSYFMAKRPDLDDRWKDPNDKPIS